MIDRDTLRSLIREVVATEVAAVKAGARAEPPRAPGETAVRVAGDADLAAFARQVLALAADPATRQAIEAGRHPFRLVASPTAPETGRAGIPAAAGPAAGPARIMEGAVTEKTIGGLPRGTSLLHVGPEVAVTPLARDKARNLKITIERIRR